MTTGLTATAAVLVIALIAAMWFWYGAQNAEDASRLAAQEARAQRDGLLLLQSRFLADRANQSSRDGDAGTAMLLALEALPDIRDGMDRPPAEEADVALFRAYQRLQEIHRSERTQRLDLECGLHGGRSTCRDSV